MAIMKRATKRLKDAGYPYLAVHRGIYGYSVLDGRFTRQTSKVHKTADEAVNAVLIDGVLPVGKDQNPVLNFEGEELEFPTP